MAIRNTAAAGIAGVALAATSSFALAQQPDGLYSADQLLDADVYAADSGKQIGEIDDIVFDNDMSIKSFVVETEGNFGLDGKSYVVQPDQMSVETMAGEHATEPKYRVTMNVSADQLNGYPEYTDSWWENTQTQAADAWEQTKQSASSAWTRIKEGTSDLIDSARDMGDDTADATEDAAQDTQDAAQDAVDDTQDATDNTTN